MNIDTLNAYCGPWLFYCPCLAQGRLNIHPHLLLWHWAFAGLCSHGFKMVALSMASLPTPGELSFLGWLIGCWRRWGRFAVVTVLPSFFDLRLGKITRRI